MSYLVTEPPPAKSKYELVVYTRKQSEMFELLPGSVLGVGRGPENAVRIDDASVSRSHARIYVSGTAAPKTKFMFNTDYYGADNKIGVMDAVAQFEFSEKFNIWAGRFLPPSRGQGPGLGRSFSGCNA